VSPSTCQPADQEWGEAAGGPAPAESRITWSVSQSSRSPRQRSLLTVNRRVLRYRPMSWKPFMRSPGSSLCLCQIPPRLHPRRRSRNLSRFAILSTSRCWAWTAWTIFRATLKQYTARCAAMGTELQ